MATKSKGNATLPSGYCMTGYHKNCPNDYYLTIRETGCICKCHLDKEVKTK